MRRQLKELYEPPLSSRDKEVMGKNLYPMNNEKFKIISENRKMFERINAIYHVKEASDFVETAINEQEYLRETSELVA